jgi:hypothetical protein
VERDLVFLFDTDLNASQVESLLGAYAWSESLSRERLRWFARRRLLRDRGLRLADKARRLVAIDAMVEELRGLPP